MYALLCLGHHLLDHAARLSLQAGILVAARQTWSPLLPTLLQATVCTSLPAGGHHDGSLGQV